MVGRREPGVFRLVPVTLVYLVSSLESYRQVDDSPEPSQCREEDGSRKSRHLTPSDPEYPGGVPHHYCLLCQFWHETERVLDRHPPLFEVVVR